MARTVLFVLLLVLCLNQVLGGVKITMPALSKNKLAVNGFVSHCKLVSLSGGAVDDDSESTIINALKKIVSSLKRYVFGSKHRYKLSKRAKRRSQTVDSHQKEEKEKHAQKNHQKNTASKSSKSKTFSGTLSTNQGLLRIQREMQSFLESPPSYCELINNSDNDKNPRKWLIRLTGPPDTIYANEKYTLSLTFPVDYPNKPPSVFFLSPVPKHKHVYTNGDICLNLLGKDWRPIITAETLAVSILSMLSSAKEKELPLDNAMHADQTPGRTQEYLYHDDKC